MDYKEKFAEAIIKFGLNLQKNQILYIKTPVEAYPLAREVAKCAYQNGAKKVIITYLDSYISKAYYMNASLDTLEEVEDYLVEEHKYLVKNSACMLSITSPSPNVMDGVDANRIKIANIASMKKLGFFREYTMANNCQWCVVAWPNEEWAKQVFKDDEDAYDKLYSAILKASRIDVSDPLQEWEKHTNELELHKDILNKYHFKTLKFKNSLGTDLSVDLVEDHIWGGGCEISQKGIRFSPNMPTEEVFTMPHSHGVNGRVVATKPLNYQGKLIEDFYLDFKDGAVVSYKALKEEATLKALLETDEGSIRLGEVALISNDSPISNMNVLFYNTLFDENASCHLALGNAYTMNIKDGYTLSKDELKKKGYNSSMIHVDFMFGSKDMSIIGTLDDGREVVIFKKGNFVI